MRAVRGGHFGSIASLATETTDGEILVVFVVQNLATEAISESFLGEHAPRFP